MNAVFSHNDLLEAAFSMNRMEYVKTLLKNHIFDLDTISYLATESAVWDKMDFLKLFCQYGAKVEPRAFNVSGQNGNYDIVKLLFSMPVRDDLMNGCGYSAAEHGYFEIVEFLIDSGMDVNINDGMLIDFAVSYEDVESVKILLERGIDINLGDRRCRARSLLARAASTGNIELVDIFIGLGVDVKNDEMAVKDATNYGHLKILKMLIEHGADPYVDGVYPYKYACRHGHLDIVKYLDEIGVGEKAWIDISLCWASSMGRISIVQYLIENKVIAKKHINRALMYALDHEEPIVANYLKSKGARYDGTIVHRR